MRLHSTRTVSHSLKTLDDTADWGPGKTARWTQIVDRCDLQRWDYPLELRPNDHFGFPSDADRPNVWHIQTYSIMWPRSRWKQWVGCALVGGGELGSTGCWCSRFSDWAKDHRCGPARPAVTTRWIFPPTEDVRNFNWTTTGQTEKVRLVREHDLM